MRIRKTVLALALAGVSVLGLTGSATAATGPQTFRLVFVGSFVAGASNTGTVSAAGPITALGSAVNSGFIVDQFGQFTGSNQLKFTGGQLNVNFGGGLTAFAFDPRTCVTRIAGTGTWTIASATGVYVGTTGSGTFVNNVTLIGKRTPQGCSQTGQTEISQITLTGTVTTP